MTKLFLIAFSAIIVENYLLVRTIGVCPFLGVSRKTETAVGMGIAVTFTITLASAMTWALYTFVLSVYHLEYMQTVTFILVIAALVQFVEMALKKLVPVLYSALGIYLPLITTNCVVLGATIDCISRNFNFIETVIYGFSAGVGFLLAIVLFSGLRERIAHNEIPLPFRGLPILLISASLLALIFTGFAGLSL